ncbi:DUF4157 domain-containing protein [uncultured Aquimarina sp.]|uniref:eCIS core domain-containing protein n=1 Tax=uncultured Aquimarina sp. TaxID=575652 RepID=UPI00260172B3|nr:DUF4157 domain-containing protein [uncultured Aquimarina sp.]
MFNSGHKDIIQPKLKIGHPNDRFEQEADQVADHVMRMPVTQIPSVQRKCEACEEEELQIKSLETAITPIVRKQEDEEEEILQMKGYRDESSSVSNLESSLQQSKGSGQYMDESTQLQMNQGIGADFSNVKIHTDTNAVQMNQQLNAKAFTNGSDVYFNQGKYNPQSSEGKHLLAHELTHVVQQRSNNEIIQRAPLPKKQFESVQYTLKRYISELHDHMDNGRTKEAKLLTPKIISYATGALSQMYGLEAAKALFRLDMTDEAIKILDAYSSAYFGTSSRGRPSQESATLIYEEGKKAFAVNKIDHSFELFERLIKWMDRNELIGTYYANHMEHFTSKMYPKVVDALISIPEFHKVNGDIAKQTTSLEKVKQLILNSKITDKYAIYASSAFIRLGDVTSASEILVDGAKDYKPSYNSGVTYGYKTIKHLIEKGNEAITSKDIENAFSIFNLAFLWIEANKEEINKKDFSSFLHKRTDIDGLFYEAMHGMLKIIDHFINDVEVDLKSGGANATTKIELVKKWMKRIETALLRFNNQNFIIAKVDQDSNDPTIARYQDANDATKSMKVTDYDTGQSPMDLILNPNPFKDRMQRIHDMMNVKTNQITNLVDFYERDKTIVELFKTKHSRTPDIHNISDRKLFWNLKYDHLITNKSSKEDAIQVLIDDIKNYLRAFSIHTFYNIPDTKKDIISGDYPESITGQALKDCGIFAMQTAYELSLIRTKANIDFYFVWVPNHVYLGIIDRDLKYGWSVNNNFISKIDQDITAIGIGPSVILANYTTFTAFDIKKIDDFSEKGLYKNYRATPNTLFLPKNYHTLSKSKKDKADEKAKELKKIYLSLNKVTRVNHLKTIQLMRELKTKFNLLDDKNDAAFKTDAIKKVLELYDPYKILTNVTIDYFKELDTIKQTGNKNITNKFSFRYYENVWTMMRWVIFKLGQDSFKKDSEMTNPAYANPDVSYVGDPVPWEKLNISLPVKSSSTTP